MKTIKNFFSELSERKVQKKIRKTEKNLQTTQKLWFDEETKREKPNSLPVRENSDEKFGEKIFKVTVYGRNALERLIPPIKGGYIIFSFLEELPPLEDLSGICELETPFIKWSLYSAYKGEMILEMYHSRGYAQRIVKIVRVFGLKNHQDINDVLMKIGANQKIKDVYMSFVK